jgi:hypothetical protein
MNTAQPDLTQLMIMAFCGLVSVLFVIIGYFLKRILKQLDGMQTTANCGQLIKSCGEVRMATLEARKIETYNLSTSLRGLTEGFDELCKCLTRFTKGECGG